MSEAPPFGALLRQLRLAAGLSREVDQLPVSGAVAPSNQLVRASCCTSLFCACQIATGAMERRVRRYWCHAESSESVWPIWWMWTVTQRS